MCEPISEVLTLQNCLIIFRIWDKLVGGSCKILVFVAVRILTTMKRRLIQLRSADCVVDSLCDVSSYKLCQNFFFLVMGGKLECVCKIFG